MSVEDCNDVRADVRKALAVGKARGESELETVTRMVSLERQSHEDLCAALERILRVATVALRRDRRALSEGNYVVGSTPLH